MSVATMSLEERRKYNNAAKRKQRERERAERAPEPDSANLSDEDKAAWTAIHQREADNLYFAKCLRVHRDMCLKLGIADVQPEETLYSFTKRVIEAVNAASPEETPIVWNIQIPDRVLTL